MTASIRLRRTLIKLGKELSVLLGVLLFMAALAFIFGPQIAQYLDEKLYELSWPGPIAANPHISLRV